MTRNKVLIICGQTATGKTALGLSLAKKFNGEVVSADSRQVYKKMDIVIGKDMPSDESKIYLTDLVYPDQEFSVSQWRKSAAEMISKLHKDGKLPIIVGGTGLYIKSLTGNIETLDVPQNKNLREQLKNKKPEEIFEMLTNINPIRAGQMNWSDKNNQRRLVRAIEVEVWKNKITNTGSVILNRVPSNTSFLIIGLKASEEILLEKIKRRIIERVKMGALSEVENLIKSGISSKSQSMSAVGYRELNKYFEKKITLDEAIDLWKKSEMRYAKKQLVWFKKQNSINWFDTTEPDWQEKVENLVSSWYN